MPKKEISEKINDEIAKKLLDAIQSEDTALEIARICFENEIKEITKIRGISYQTGRVLVGDLALEDLGKILEEKVPLPSFIASKIAREINESIFFPIKETLYNLYGAEDVSQTEITPVPEKKSSSNFSRKDSYREPIEEE